MTTLTNNLNNQLFTNLTSEEAAVIEEGFINLKRLHAIEITSDDRRRTPKVDEIYIRAGRQTIWGWKSMRKGQKRNISTKRNSVYASSIDAVQLWEYDRGAKQSDRLYITAFQPRSKDYLVTFEGSGGKYRMSYSGPFI